MRERILYCVLDWGLGHATRSVPIIRSFCERGCDVLLASDNLALDFLRSEFPSLPTYKLPTYGVEYKSENLLLNGIYNWRGIRSAIKAEHGMVGMIVAKENISAIITDNRYGCYAPGVPSVLVTHQLQFRTGNPIQDKIGRIAIHKMIKPFDRIWIPDDAEHTLSGVISESKDPRIRYIGWQSTLSRNGLRDNSGEQFEGKLTEGQKEFKIAAILSGPEPMRTSFEAEVREQFESNPFKFALVRGKPGSNKAKFEGNLTVYDVLDRNEIQSLMNSASIILCRSGYSSLMDLKAIGQKAILIPTPGQPEQKYLGERMKSNTQFVVQKAGTLNISTAIKQLEKIKPTDTDISISNMLDIAIEDVLKIQ